MVHFYGSTNMNSSLFHYWEGWNCKILNNMLHQIMWTGCIIKLFYSELQDLRHLITQPTWCCWLLYLITFATKIFLIYFCNQGLPDISTHNLNQTRTPNETTISPLFLLLEIQQWNHDIDCSVSFRCRVLLDLTTKKRRENNYIFSTCHLQTCIKHENYWVYPRKMWGHPGY